MSYVTKNEMEHFDFHEAHVGNVQITDSIFDLVLDNVKILPENSCNRDIRMMRCNELLFQVVAPRELKVVREGYKEYDANGNLRHEYEDVPVEKAEYPEVFEALIEGEVYSFDQVEDTYTILVDAMDDRSYVISVKGSGDKQDWERFLNLASM